MQCGKCSGTCPNYDEMEYHPHQFVAMVRKGEIDKLMQSRSIYMCLSCFACVERCPRNVEPAKLIEAVRLAVIRQQNGNHMSPDDIPAKLGRQASAAGDRERDAQVQKVGDKTMQRIGVFVCWCGSNIAATVDVKRVAEAVKAEPGVVFSTDYQYMCSENGQALIRNAIKEHGLTGVVICSCSPRMHEATFRKTATLAGINPYMVEIANIREQCSWIHKDMPEGTEKAIILARAAIAKVNLNAPLTAGDESGYEARAGHRRRHRGYSDGAGRCGRGLRGRYR